MTKKDFPKLVNTSLEEGLTRAADGAIRSFQKEVFPLLYKIGLLDDKHVKKYLASETMEAIYKDALKENPAYIYALEQKALLEELKEEPKDREDVWNIFREPKCEVNSPKEEGFVFRSMPGIDSRSRNLVLKAVSVNNLNFSIDKEFLAERCIVKPTDEQIELYNKAWEFCEFFNEKNLVRKYNIRQLFCSTEKGAYPSINAILGLLWLREIK